MPSTTRPHRQARKRQPTFVIRRTVPPTFHSCEVAKMNMLTINDKTGRSRSRTGATIRMNSGTTTALFATLCAFFLLNGGTSAYATDCEPSNNRIQDIVDVAKA